MKTFKKVLILGSGGLRIGQAGEFDYSGSQAIKALKEERIRSVLVNPNIATVQTDPTMADEVYFQPLNTHSLIQIIEKERPDGIFLSFGGQTALNLGLELEEANVFADYNIEILGTSPNSIRQTEDRDHFKENLESIGVKTPKSYAVSTLKEAMEAAEKIGYPIMLRSAFSLGGLGSGKIDNEKDLILLAQQALHASPQLLIEEYLLGWKELEYEVVRDRFDQALTICNMENLDPMGIHTGESIVVAPSQTLNNEEYHSLRMICLKLARHFEIQGECNVQFALHPQTGDYRVIEMNARLSRSSALASKATGYPLAFVAAKLALGYGLHEVPNAITKKTSAFFEPALDYVVVKIPRWDIQKLKSASRQIGTEMKSVGEVMAIGRSFPEALQKAVRMLNLGATGIEDLQEKPTEIQIATDQRIFALYSFFKEGGTTEKAHQLTQIDPWFLHQIQRMSLFENELAKHPLDQKRLLEAKKLGFSDFSIGRKCEKTESEIRSQRKEWGITPTVRQIDTFAGEFEAQTNYLYCTYLDRKHDLPPGEENSIIVLGSGPYSIGSSVEFDWCAVNTARTLRKNGKYTIMINSNPETVSTDFDESDRLYFEELTLERVLDIAEFEKEEGIIVSVGGQIANNLALSLEKEGIHLLGTTGASIDKAESRDRFSTLLHDLGIDQPAWESVSSLESAIAFAKRVGFPVLIRPSYVLSGAAMRVVHSENELECYLSKATSLSSKHATVISKFIEKAKELEVDGIAEKGKVQIDAISEHIENAGVHSGDATLVLPPQKLYLETIRRAKRITRKIVKALEITGPFNLQFIAKENELQVIECNVRASRSFPFVSKVTGHNLIEICTEILLGVYQPKLYETLELDHVGIKTPQFSYQRLKGADPVAHVEMASTGEVACLGDDFLGCFFTSWLATGQSVPEKKVLVCLPPHQREKFLEPLRKLEEKSWDLFSTEETHDFLSQNGIGSIFVHKLYGNSHSASSLIEKKEVDLILIIPEKEHGQDPEGFKLRRLAIDHHIPLITNPQIALVFLQCLAELELEKIPVRSWKEYMQ